MAIIYEIGFRTNTSALQQQIAQINSDIQKAFELRNKGELGKEVERGVAAASALKTILQQATTNKGLSFVSMNIALRQANLSAGDLVKTLSSAGMHSSVNTFVQSFAAADRSVLSISARMQDLQHVMAQSFKFSTAQQILRFFQRVFRDGIQWSKDMNTVLTEISIVSGKTGSALDSTMTAIVKGAADLRVAAKEYAEAAVIFYQQGLADDEVERRTQTTIKAAKASGAAVKEMSEQLTAVWNTYQMEGDELARAASQGARLGAETAVDFAYIAEAMQTAATSASQLGVSYESLTAIIATVGETTLQSASTVGNAYKTIFSRFANLKTTGEDQGVTLGRISQQFADMGINILDAAGELRELDDVIMEVGLNWDNYSAKQQQAIAQIAGGTRQYGQFLALMQNFDKYQKNLASANSEIGSSTLEAQYAVYLNSVEAMAAQASEAWAQAVGGVFDARGLKAFYQAIRDIGKIVDDITEGLGGFEGIIGYISAILISKIGPTMQKIAITGREIWNNRTMAASIENSNKQFDQMIAKINQVASARAQLNAQGRYELVNSGAPLNSASIADNQYLTAKLEISKQLAVVQTQLQKVQRDGNAVEKVLAEDLRAQLTAKQELVNKSLDSLRAIEREAAAQKALNNDIIEQVRLKAQAAGTRSPVGKGGQNATNAMFTALETARQTAVATKGNYNPEDLNKIAADLRKVSSAARGLNGEPITKLREAFRQTATEIQNGSKTVVQGIEQVKQAVAEYNAAIAADPTATNQLFGNEEAAQNMEAAMSSAATGVQELTGATSDLGAASDEANNLISAAGVGVFNFGQAMSTAAGSVAGFMISLQNIFSLISSGEASFTSLMTSMLMFLPSTMAAISSIKSLVAAYTSLSAVKGLVSALNMSELSTEVLLQAAKRAGIELTAQEQLLDAGALKVVIARKAATMGLVTAQTAENGVIAANTPIVAANAAAWWAHPVILIIGAAVLAVIAAFSAFNAMLKANVESTKRTAESTRETAESMQNLTTTVRENTEAVKENADVWVAARQSGKDSEEQYEKLTKSLATLNDSLLQAGASQEYLNKLMTEGLATGDLSAYYDEVGRIQDDLTERSLAASANAQRAQLLANKAQMEKDNWSNSSRSIRGDKTTYNHNNTRNGAGAIEITFSDNMQEIIDKYEVFKNETSKATIQMNFEDPAEFKESYEELISAKEDMERTFTTDELSTNATYKALTETINELSESYVYLQEQAQISRQEISDAIAPAVSLVDVKNSSFTENVAAINAVTEAIKQQGEVAGLTSAEIEGLTRSVIASNPDLNKVLAVSEMANDMIYRLSDQSGDFKYDNMEDYQEAIKELSDSADEWTEKANEHKAGIFNWGTLGNSKSFDEEVEEMRNSAANFASAREDMEEEFKKWQDFDKMRADVLNFFDNLSQDDAQLLLKIGVDNVSAMNAVEEMGKKIDQYKDVTLRIKAEIVNDPVLELETINEFQKNMSNAVKEFTAEGNSISADTVQELLSMGPEYKRYLIETEKGYALTTEGINAYNESIEKERQLTTALLESIIKPNEALKDFAYQIADLAAIADNVALYDFATEVKDLTIDFVNGDIASEDFFNNLNSQLETVTAKIQDLNADDLKDFVLSLGDLGASLATYHQSAVEAWQAGDIGATELRQALRDSASVALNASRAVEKSLTSVEGKMELVTKNAEGIYEPLSEDSAEAKKFAEELNAAAKNTSKLETAISSLDLYEDLGKTFEDSYEQLSILFGDDFIVRPELDISQFEEAVSTLTPMFEEMTNWFSNLSGEMQETVSRDLQQVVDDYYNSNRQVLANAQGLLNGTVAASSLSQAELGSAIGAIATATGQSVTNASSAIGEVMGGIADLIENFDYSVDITPKGEIGIELPNLTSMSWTDIVGQRIPITIDGKLSLGIKGSAQGSSAAAISRIKNAANYFSQQGINDILGRGGNPNIADLSDFMPEKEGPVAGDPDDLDTGNDGKKKKGGGGGSDKEAKKEQEMEQIKLVKRYENLTEVIEEQTRVLEKLGAASDKAFGIKKLALLAKQVQETQKLAKSYELLYKEAQGYYELDKKAFLKGNPNATFLEDGSVANPEEIRKYWEDYANAAVGDYNNVLALIETQVMQAGGWETKFSESQIEAWDKMKEAAKEGADAAKAYADTQIELLDQVQETAQKVQEELQNQIDNIRNWFELKMAEVTEKLELRISIREQDIRLLDYLIDKLGETAVRTADRLHMINTQALELYKNMEDTRDSVGRLQEIMENLNDSSKHQSWFEGKFGKDAWNEWMETGEAPAQVIEQLLQYADDLLEFNKQMLDYNETIWGALKDALNAYLSDFDNLISKYDTHETMLSSWLNVWQKSGKAYKDNSLSLKLLNAQVDNAGQKLESLKIKMEGFSEAAKMAEDAYQQELNGRADPEILERLKSQLDEANKIAADAQNEFYTNMSSYMDLIAEKASEAALLIEQEWIKSLGGVFSSIDSAMDMYNQKYTLDTFFLDENDKTFEINKLIKEITKSLDDMTDPAMIEKYNKMIDSLNGKLTDGTQITQKQLDILKAEFDLEMERDKYKEAQANKNTMRLARDTSGNWSYVYSNDSGEEEDSAAAIEEKINNIYKMHRDAADEAAQMWLQLQVEWEKYEITVDQIRYQNDEAYRKEVDLRRTWYMQQADLYKEQVIYHNEAIGRSFDDTTLGVITDFDTMEEANNHYKESHNELWNQLQENHDKWQDKAKETMENVGWSYDTLEDTIKSETDKIQDENERTGESIIDLKNTMLPNIQDIIGAQQSWANEWVSRIRDMIQANEDLIRSIMEVARAMADMEGSGRESVDDWSDLGTWIESENKDANKGEDTRKTVLELGDSAIDAFIANTGKNAEQGRIIKNLLAQGGYGYDTDLGQWVYWDSDKRKRKVFAMSSYISDMLAGTMSDINKYKVYDTGGLATGPQIAGLAMDGKKELVLNASDTENFLQAISIMRDGIASYLSTIGMKQAGLVGATHSQSSDIASDQPPVIIQADFPNVTAREEIEAAFANLVNQAAQYKLKPRD